MAIDLFDFTQIDNDTPGVAWLATTIAQNIGGNDSRIVFDDGGINLQATEQVDTEYIEGGATAYVGNIAASSFGLIFQLGPTLISIQDQPGPQFTDAAESNLAIAFRTDSLTLKYRLIELVLSDTTEPYLWIVNFTTSELLAIRNSSEVQSILFDISNPAIDYDNLQLREVPETPAAPTVTAPTPTSIRIALPADPISDATIIRRDIQYLRPDQSIFIMVEDITSPHTISNGITELSEYEVRWRAVSAIGNGAWSLLTTVTTPAAIFQTSADTDSLVQLSVNANVELGDTLLLSDFDDTDLITSPALVLLRSNSDPNNPRIWGRGPREVTGTELLDGEFDISPSNEPINQIRFRLDGESDYGDEQITIHDDGPLNLREYFTSGDGNNLTLWIQTSTDVAEIPMGENYDRGGGNFAAFNVPSQYQSIISSVTPSSRFIVAMTLPAKVLAGAITDSPIQLSVNANAVLGDAPLLLFDFDDTALNTSPALVLLTRGDDSGGSGIWGRGVREVSNSRLIDGEFDISPSNEPINQIRFRLDGESDYGDEQISFHDNGPLDLRTYFTGDGNNLTLWIQTSTGVAEIPMGENYDRGGSNFAIFDVPLQYQFIISSINPRDRFILAMTFPILLMTEADTNSFIDFEVNAEANLTKGPVISTQANAGLRAELSVNADGNLGQPPPLQAIANVSIPLHFSFAGTVNLIDAPPLQGQANVSLQVELSVLLFAELTDAPNVQTLANANIPLEFSVLANAHPGLAPPLITLANTESQVLFSVNANASITDAPPLQSITNTVIDDLELSVSAVPFYPLTLSLFDDTGLIIDALALIENNSSPGTTFYNHIPIWPIVGRLLDGEIGISPNNEITIGRIIRFTSGRLGFNTSGPGHTGDYFNDGNSVIILQTVNGREMFYVPPGIQFSDGAFISINTPSDFDDLLLSITDGERFIFAVANYIPIYAIGNVTDTLEFSVNANSELGPIPPLNAEANWIANRLELSIDGNADLAEILNRQTSAISLTEILLSVNAEAESGEIPTLKAVAANELEVILSVNARANPGSAPPLETNTQAELEIQLSVYADAIHDQIFATSIARIQVELSTNANASIPLVINRPLEAMTVASQLYQESILEKLQSVIPSIVENRLAIIPDIAPIDYQILVDWNGNGLFDHPLSNIYGDVVKNNGVYANRGKFFSGSQFSRSAAGESNFTLRNDERKYDSNNDEFGTLGNLVDTKKRIQIRMRRNEQFSSQMAQQLLMSEGGIIPPIARSRARGTQPPILNPYGGVDEQGIEYYIFNRGFMVYIDTDENTTDIEVQVMQGSEWGPWRPPLQGEVGNHPNDGKMYFIMQDLSLGQSYRVRVCKIPISDDYIEFPGPNEDGVISQLMAPTPITELFALPGPAEVNVSWDTGQRNNYTAIDPSITAIEYKLYSENDLSEGDYIPITFDDEVWKTFNIILMNRTNGQGAIIRDGSVYNLSLRTRNEVGISNIMPIVQFRPDLSARQVAPRIIQIDPVAGGLNVYWQHDIPNSIDYIEYRVKFGVNLYSSWIRITDILNSYINISQLAPVEYSIQIRAGSIMGESASQPSYAEYATPLPKVLPPMPPGQNLPQRFTRQVGPRQASSFQHTLTATAGDEQVSLDWDDFPSGLGTFTGWALEWRTGGGSWNNLTVGLSQTSQTHTGLTNGQTYQYRIRSWHSGVGTQWSSTQSATPMAEGSPDPPAAPTGLTATVSGTTINISWNSVDNAISYDLRYWTQPEGWQDLSDPTSASYSHRNLVIGREYYYAVSAINNAGQSDFSPNAGPYTPVSPSMTPTVLIDTSPQTINSGERLQLRITTNGPVSSYLWTSTSNAGSFDPNSTSAEPIWVAPSPSSETGYTLRIRVTGTDNLSSDDTVVITVRATDTITAPGQVTSISTSNVTQSSITVSWNSPSTGSPATGYDIRWRETGTDPWTQRDDRSSAYTISGLDDDTQYDIQIRAKNSAGDGPWSNTHRATTSDATVDSPGIPTSLALTPSQVNTGVVIANWSPPSGGGEVDTYELRYKLVTNSNWIQVNGITSTNETFTVTENGTYEAQVRSRNNGGISNWSSSRQVVVNVIPGVNPPGIPTSLALTNSTTAGRIIANWSIGSGGTPTSYHLRYKRTNVQGWSTTSNITDTNYVISGLSIGQEYEVQVRALNADGISNWTSSRTITVQTIVISEPPDIPTSLALTLSQVNTGVVIANWSPPSGGGTVDTYELRYKLVTNSNWIQVNGITSTNQTFTVTENGTYETQVRARNDDGISNWTSSREIVVNAIPGANPPGIPTSLALTNSTTAGRIIVNWSPPNSGGTPTSYHLRYKLTNIQGWTTTSNITDTNYVINNLLIGQEYEVQVRAFNADGTSNWTSSRTITVQTITINEPPGIPTSLAVVTSQVESGIFIANWSPPNSGGTVDTYELRYKLVTVSQWIEITSLTSTNIAITVTENGTYEVQVRARNSHGVSSWTSSRQVVINVTPGVNPPGIPTSLILSNTSTLGTINVSWFAGSGGTPTSYELRWKLTTQQGWTNRSNITNNSFQIAGLSIGFIYEVQVRARNADGVSSYSDSQRITVVMGVSNVPAIPTNLALQVINEVNIMATWSPGSGGGIPTSYNLRYKLSSNNSWMTINDVSSGYTIISLMVNSLYDVQVQAFNTSGNSEWGPTVQATTGFAPAPGSYDEPTGLQATAGDQVILLEWDDPNNPDITGYEYSLSNGMSWISIMGAGPDTTEYLIEDLTNGISYTIIIRSLANQEFSNVSNEVMATPMPVKPDAPTGLTGIAGDLLATLFWTNPDNISIGHYEYSFGEPIWVEMEDSHRNTVMYVLLNLINDFEYIVRIRAVSNSGLVSDPSLPISVIPMPQVTDPPLRPTGLISIARDGGAQISWDNPDDPFVNGHEYIITNTETGRTTTWEGIPGGGYPSDSSPNRLQYTIYGLENDVTYIIRIRAFNRIGFSPQSNSTTVIPGSTWKTIWGGIIDEFKFNDEKSGKDTVDVICLGPFVYLTQNNDINTALQSNENIAENLHLICQAAFMPEALIGNLTANNTLRWWWVDNRNGMVSARALEQTEGGRLYENRHGPVTLDGIDTIQHKINGGPIAFFSDDLSPNTYHVIETEVIQAAKELINEINIPIRQYTTSVEAVLWEYSNTNTLIIQPGQTLAIKSRHDLGGVAAWSIPFIPYNDYEANSSPLGIGTDLTGNLVIQFVEYGQELRMNITNISTQVAYITKLQARGRALREDSNFSMPFEDTNSIIRDGRRPITLRESFFADISHAQSVGDYLLSIVTDPVDRLQFSYYAGMYPELTEEIEIGDLLSLRRNNVTQEYTVENVAHSWLPEEHKVTCELSPVSSQVSDFMVLDEGPPLGVGRLGR